MGLEYLVVLRFQLTLLFTSIINSSKMRTGFTTYCVAIIALYSRCSQGKDFHKDAGYDSPIRKPVVLVPGVLGTRLQAKINLTESPGWFCPKVHDWFDLWLNLDELVPWHISCWVYEISMHYKPGNRQPMNTPGVDTRVQDFGGTSAFEFLDKNHKAPGSPYFSVIVESLVKLGYTRHGDLKGLPFDWRITPSLNESLLLNLTKLIEDNYYQHSNRRVVIIGHSMGNMLIYYYLKRQPQAWKDKFIDSFVSINSPYLGSVKAIKAIISGETEGHDEILNRLKMRESSRTFPSSFLLLPKTSLWPTDKSVVVATAARNYTVHDYKALFKDINCEKCWELYNYFGEELGDLSAPNVEVHCVYSSQLPTADILMYDAESFPDDAPTFKMGSGDTTVNTFSSSYCLNWRAEQSQPVHDVSLPGNDHVGILMNSTLIDYIGNVVMHKSSIPKRLKFDHL